MSKQVVIWTLVTAIIIFSGCAQKQIAKPQPVCLAGVDVNSAMERIEKVLLKMDFVVDKADPIIGYMRTRPFPGSQFFEVWKRDNRDGYSSGLANLGSIQRTAELYFDKSAQQLCVDCNVTIERLSLPEKEIDNVGKVCTLFTGRGETTGRLVLNITQQKGMEWINLGQDNKLEKYILDKINKEFTPKKVKR